MKHTRLAERPLPNYSVGEEIANSAIHLTGGVLGIAATVFCILMACTHGNVMGITASAIYGASLMALYFVSGIYHGLRPGMGKKVMQVIDHCTIFFLIAGTYTVLLLGAIVKTYPFIAWGLFILEWGLGAVAVVLTAIDLNEYAVFSMTCYIGMGWAIILFARQVRNVLGGAGFQLLLWGGIAYTVGAVLYGIGSRRKWIHSVFHVFVLLGSVLHFFTIFLYAL